MYDPNSRQYYLYGTDDESNEIIHKMFQYADEKIRSRLERFDHEIIVAYEVTYEEMLLVARNRAIKKRVVYYISIGEKPLQVFSIKNKKPAELKLLDNVCRN